MEIELAHPELRASVQLESRLAGAVNSGTGLSVAHDCHLAVRDAEVIEVPTNRVAASLTESHVVLLGTALVTMAFDRDRGTGLAKRASTGLQKGLEFRLDRRLIEIEVDRGDRDVRGGDRRVRNDRRRGRRGFFEFAGVYRLFDGLDIAGAASSERDQRGTKDRHKPLKGRSRNSSDHQSVGASTMNAQDPVRDVAHRSTWSTKTS